MAELRVFQAYRPELRRELETALAISPLLGDMLRYHMGWVDEKGQSREVEGKMVRPTLCLLACKAAGGDYRQALPAAAAVELAHNFSLIHDDIEDSSPLRRHRPTLWRIWGQPQAINAGDATLVLARLAILRSPERGIEPEKTLHLAQILDEACLKMCQGQNLDMAYEGRLDIRVEDYLEMISQKTAVLFQAALHIGAIIGTDNKRVAGALASFGYSLGLAFQIQDDTLGIWGEETNTGKSISTDIGTRKMTLPLVYALERATGTEREALERIYAQKSIGEGETARVMEILHRAGAREYTQGMAEKYFRQAHSHLEATGLAPSEQQELAEVAAYLLGRSY